MTASIEERFDQPPSEAARQGLEALRIAVARALDRKRRLGQYAVVWHAGRVKTVPPEALPVFANEPLVAGACTSESNRQ